MKKILLLFTLLAGVVSAMAQGQEKVEEFDLTADLFHVWDSPAADASISDNNGGGAFVLNEASGLPYGDGNVSEVRYADLSEYDQLVVTVTDGAPRFLFNRDIANGQWAENEAESHLIDNTKNGWSSKYFSSEQGDGFTIWTVDLKGMVVDLGYAHLHCIKGANWANVTVTSMTLIKVTEENVPEPQYEEKVEEFDLTADLFHVWDSPAADASITDNNGGGACVLNEGSGLPYGDGNVSEVRYADLSEYDQLVVTVTDGAPRFLFNRDIANGQWADTQSESHLIDNTKDGWSAKYFSSEQGDGETIWTVDLKQMVADLGYAHLHSIKGANWANVTVTSMTLVKVTLVPVEQPEEQEYVEVVESSDLDDSLFHLWDSAAAGASITETNGGGVCVLNESTGMPFGHGSVLLNGYADLSEYDKLVLTVSEGAPRFLFNRDVNEGQWSENEAESHLIDNTKGGWSAKYFSSEQGDGVTIWTVDLKQLVADKGYAHLHSIKGANWANVTVTSMELQKVTLVPVAKPEYEEVEIESDLTQGMFKEWSSPEADANVVNENGYGAYDLNNSTGLPYGDGSVTQTKYADLSEYDKLVLTVTEGTPRLLFNTKGVDPNKSYLEIKAAGSYATQDGTTWTIDLKKIVADKGFAHLNCIKGANWQNTTITSMKLVKVILVEKGTQMNTSITTPGQQHVKLADDSELVDGGVYDVNNDQIEEGFIIQFPDAVVKNPWDAAFLVFATLTDTKGGSLKLRSYSQTYIKGGDDYTVHLAQGLFEPEHTYILTIDSIQFTDFTRFCEESPELMALGFDGCDPLPLWANQDWCLGNGNGVTTTITINTDATVVPQPVKSRSQIVANLGWQFPEEKEDDGEATAIRGIDVRRDAVIYDLRGQRVDAPTRGIYIIGGKKVVLK